MACARTAASASSPLAASKTLEMPHSASSRTAILR
jgi:hypothetical protein